MIYRLIIFLVLNFAALGIGGLFTSKGVSAEWYQNLSKAPWTPPGWVFGFAWTTIMICFAFYMANAWKLVPNRNLLIGLFIFQWILNVLWNPVFFKYQAILAGFVIISALTLLVAYLLFGYLQELKFKVLWVLPYFLWLLVATSLNAYIFMKN